MQWDWFDWALAFALFAFALGGSLLASRDLKGARQAIIGWSVIGIFFLLIWAELAFGILD